MKQVKTVTHIGDTTYGAYSTASFNKVLPNGWEYDMSHQLFLTPEGKNLDRIGSHPDITVKNNLKNIENGRDLVLERALELLD